MNPETEKYFTAPVLGAAYYPEDWDEADIAKKPDGSLRTRLGYRLYEKGRPEMCQDGGICLA